MQADAQKVELFERMPIPRVVAKLSIPTVLASLVIVLYNLADTYFVGMLNDAVQNAAVTLAAPVMLAFNAVTNLFGVGSSSMMSRALGARDFQTVSRSSAFGFWCALTGAALLSTLCCLFREPLLSMLGTTDATRQNTWQYMQWTVVCGAVPAILNVLMAFLVRAEGAALHASIGTMSGCILNMILDPLFILPSGLNLGAAGAGMATFIGNCFACTYFMFLLRLKRGHTYISLDPRKALHCGRHVVTGICAVGVPSSIQNLLNVTGMTILNNFAAAWGADAVAGMGIASKIQTIPFQISLGMSQGIMPLISYNFSTRNTQRMKGALRFSGIIGVSFTILMLIIYQLFPGQLVSLFIDTPSVIACGQRFLRGLSISMPLITVDFLAVGVFQACGMGGKALLFAILRKIVLEIPLLFLLNTLFPLYGLAYAQPTAEFVLTIAALFMLRRLFRDLGKTPRPVL